MKRILAITIVVLAALELAGCGRFGQREREPWRRQAELACLRAKKINPSDYVRPMKAIDSDWSCGADFPLKVAAFANETTASIPGQPGGQAAVTSITPEAVLVCPMVAAMDEWVETVIQPAALARFGQPVVQIKTMGSYNCRPRNNQSGARLSEHGFANAVDIGGFVLADGTTVTVVHDWTKGSPEQKAFLREVHAGACRMFTTVLGPGSNIFHYNHIHVDLARHGVKGDRHYCRPEPNSVAPPVEPTPTDLMDRNLESRSAALRRQNGQGQGQPQVATAYVGRPGPSPAAPVYNQAGRPVPPQQVPSAYDSSAYGLVPAGGQRAPAPPTLHGQAGTYTARPPAPIGRPLAIGVQPPSDGNDDESLDIRELDDNEFEPEQIVGQARR